MFKAHILILAAAVGLTPTAPAFSQDAPADQKPVVEVTLSNFKFDPMMLHLKAGQPIILRLSNSSSGGHDFGAPEFFAAAQVDPDSSAQIRKGEVEVAGHQSVDISLVPAAGTYKLVCDHPFHASLGMKGDIIVE